MDNHHIKKSMGERRNRIRVLRYVALILFLFAISGSDHRPDSRFTLIDANGVLFQQSSWSFLQPLQFIYRYGIFSMLKLHYFIQGMLNDFSNIYAFLDEGLEFYTTGVESLLPICAWIFRAQECTQCF